MRIDRDIGALYSADAAASGARPDLLILEKGLWSPSLAAAFATPAWSIDLVETLPLPKGHHWMFARSDSQDPTGHDPPLDETGLGALRAAAGLEAPARGNVRCTWWIRPYNRRTSSNGDAKFFDRIAEGGEGLRPVTRALLDAIRGLQTATADAGGSLLVEQITIVLAKDASAPLATLTPRLHADEYYGRRETAIAALLERGWSPWGGAMFLPTLRMSDLGCAGPVGLDELDAVAAGAPVLVPGTGDVLLYDGMIGPDGQVDRRLGTPHISADVAGRSARLVVLMRHMSPPVHSGQA
ncbi:hypothetical protein MU516_16160 [Paracoccus sp. YLB-12]|uniref:Uncharacterized protein n=1 Tax=Paracoccus maritimus TaxID=2933292 RepID=A0ABT2KCX3_9RHOB|nr:hypothetical protein [Paracoccus sp. YLB-12]MCT4334397.1 hypothetical protein [Paracoccus sp. YLB-12]